jgi:Protein of unknown function (DUF1113).
VTTGYNSKRCWIINDLVLFIFFGVVYCLIEILYRGYTFPSMFLLGGICGVLIGEINEHTPDMPLWAQCILGSLIITFFELLCGLMFNTDYHIWNYTNLPFNFKGQICLYFTGVWCVLSLPAIFLDDCIRNVLKLR